MRIDGRGQTRQSSLQSIVIQKIGEWKYCSRHHAIKFWEKQEILVARNPLHAPALALFAWSRSCTQHRLDDPSWLYFDQNSSRDGTGSSRNKGKRFCPGIRRSCPRWFWWFQSAGWQERPSKHGLKKIHVHEKCVNLVQVVEVNATLNGAEAVQGLVSQYRWVVNAPRCIWDQAFLWPVIFPFCCSLGETRTGPFKDFSPYFERKRFAALRGVLSKSFVPQHQHTAPLVHLRPPRSRTSRTSHCSWYSWDSWSNR